MSFNCCLFFSSLRVQCLYVCVLFHNCCPLVILSTRMSLFSLCFWMMGDFNELRVFTIIWFELQRRGTLCVSVWMLRYFQIHNHSKFLDVSVKLLLQPNQSRVFLLNFVVAVAAAVADNFKTIYIFNSYPYLSMTTLVLMLIVFFLRFVLWIWNGLESDRKEWESESKEAPKKRIESHYKVLQVFYFSSQIKCVFYRLSIKIGHCLSIEKLKET